MSAKDIVRKFVDAIDRGDVDAAINLCADDLQFVGPAPKTLGKSELRSMMNALCKAFPDWSFHARDYVEAGDKCECKFEITGTNRGDLSLPFPGMQTVRATGKSIKMPQENPKFTVRNGKISKLEVEVGPNGGVMGILSQLGVSTPAQAGMPRARPSAPSHP